jgi:ankyrin repeat protein
MEHTKETISQMLKYVGTGDVEAAKQLLDSTPGLIHAIIGSESLLNHAASYGTVEMATLFIKYGCDLKKYSITGKHKSSALDSAISADKPKMVELLLQNGVKSLNDRPILAAIVGQKKHSLELIKLLHQHGTNLHEVFLNEYTGEKINALSYAIAYKRHDVVDYLKAHGCVMPGEQPRIDAPKQTKDQSMEYTKETVSQMLKYVETGDVEAAKQLLDSTPGLIHAVIGSESLLNHAASYGTVEMATLFIKRGCDLKKYSTLGKHKSSALDDAISADKPKMVELLLKYGVESLDKRRLLTAIVGQKKHSLELIKLLHQHGTNLHEVFLNEYTGEKINALSYAIAYKRHDVVDYLKAHGCVMPDQEPLSATQQQDDDLISEYFEEYYGPVDPRSLIEIVPQHPSIAIHAVPANAKHKCLTLFTSGMSDEEMVVPAEGERFSRAELFIQLPANWPYQDIQNITNGWPVHWLRALASFPFKNGTWLGGEVAIASQEITGIPIGSGFDSMLILCEKFIDLGTDQSVALYRLFPLTPAERKLEMTQGIGALLRKFDVKDVKFVVDLNRTSVV